MEVRIGRGERFRDIPALFKWLRGRSPRKLGHVFVRGQVVQDTGGDTAAVPAGHTVEFWDCLFLNQGILGFYPCIKGVNAPKA